MKEYIDQMNQTIRLSGTPRRIVSLVPSQTELLFDLGLEDSVVGITKFCIYPDEWFRSKKRVGGTKNVDFEKVKLLKPDLIIGNKEENEKENIEKLTEIAPVWMSDINSLEDALKMIGQIGVIVDKTKESNDLIEGIKSKFLDLDTFIRENIKEKKTVLYIIWNDPVISVGTNTFINDMLIRCGLTNFMAESRYPVYVKENNKIPDYVFLSSEPFPFNEKHLEQMKNKFPDSLIRLVDGEFFSWYGSRLSKAPDYFIELIT